LKPSLSQELIEYYEDLNSSFIWICPSNYTSEHAKSTIFLSLSLLFVQDFSGPTPFFPSALLAVPSEY
jgi:hypothetical protein